MLKAKLPKMPETTRKMFTSGDFGGIIKTDANGEWITVNSTPVPVDGNGELQGAIGEKIMDKSIDFDKVNKDVHVLINQGSVNPNIGTAKPPVPREITGVNTHALRHGVTREKAQEFINNSVVMFDQGDRSLFVSGEGNAVLLDENNRLISAYPEAKFDPGIKAILEVLNNG